MEHLRQALADVARVPRLLVASDFDGTVSPIVNHPADARALDQELQAAAREAFGPPRFIPFIP